MKNRLEFNNENQENILELIRGYTPSRFNNQEYQVSKKNIINNYINVEIPITKTIIKKFTEKLDTISENQKKDSVKIKEIHQKIVKIQKKKGEKLITRDALSYDIYSKIMNLKKRKREKILHYCRFRVSITLLFHTGLRVNEIRTLTREEIEKLFQGRAIVIKQTKVNANRTIAIGPQALNKISQGELKALQQDLYQVFDKHETLGGTKYPTNWISFINNKLLDCLKRLKIPGNYKSHSFRINYINKLLEKYSLHQVQKFVGHQNISTTILYSRWNPSNYDIAQASDCLVN